MWNQKVKKQANGDKEKLWRRLGVKRKHVKSKSPRAFCEFSLKVWRWICRHQPRSVFNKVAQFNLCGRSCAVMKPLSFNFCLLDIHKEKRARQPSWRHANTLISLIRASPNWTAALTSRTNALRTQTCAGQEERRWWPTKNSASFILFSTLAVTFCLFAYC